MPNQYVLRIIGLVNGQPTSLDGQWLVEYDPTRPGRDPQGRPMSAHIVCTADPARARRFHDAEAALRYRMTESGRPYPADRPLVAFTVEIAEVSDA